MVFLHCYHGYEWCAVVLGVLLLPQTSCSTTEGQSTELYTNSTTDVTFTDNTFTAEADGFTTSAYVTSWTTQPGTTEQPPQIIVGNLDSKIVVPLGCNQSLLNTIYLAGDFPIAVTSHKSGYNPYTTFLEDSPPGPDTWCASNTDVEPALTLHFRQPLVILSLALGAGGAHDNAWIHTFRVSFLDDDFQNETATVFYPDNFTDIAKDFSGPSSRYDSVTVALDTPILTTTLSIHPQTWNGEACLTLQVIGCAQHECAKHGLAPGESVTVGDTLCSQDGLAYAQVHSDGVTVYNIAGEQATVAVSDTLSLGLVPNTSLTVIRSPPGTDLALYTANNLVGLAFSPSGSLCLYNTGGHPVWCSHSGELTGHGQGGEHRSHCISLLSGRPSSDVFIASSTQATPLDYVSHAFLDTPHIPDIQRGGWCPDPGDSEPYLDVYLAQPTHVYGVSVQTGEVKLGSSDAVTSYWVLYKSHREVLEFRQVYDERGTNIFQQKFNGPQTNQGNEIGTTYFTDPIKAEVLRILPKNWQGSPCMRVDILQCSDNVALGGLTYYKGEGYYQVAEDTDRLITDSDRDTCQVAYVHSTAAEVWIDFGVIRHIVSFDVLVGRNGYSWGKMDAYVSMEPPGSDGSLPSNTTLCYHYDDVTLRHSRNHNFTCYSGISGRYFILDVTDSVLKVEICRLRTYSDTDQVVSRLKPTLYMARTLYISTPTPLVTDGIRYESGLHGYVHDNPGLYVDLGQDLWINGVGVASSEDSGDDLVGVYLALLPASINKDPLYYVWKGDLGAMETCERVGAGNGLTPGEFRQIDCTEPVFGRYLMVFRITGSGALVVSEVEAYTRSKAGSLEGPDWQSPWTQFSLSVAAPDSLSRIPYPHPQLPTLVRLLVASGSPVSRETLVYDSLPYHWASSLCALPTYFTESEIIVVKPTPLGSCLQKLLCTGSSPWEGPEDGCPYTDVYYMVQTWSFCTLTPNYQSRWKDVYIDGSLDEASMEFRHNMGTVPMLGVAQFQIESTSGNIYYSQFMGSSQVGAPASLLYTAEIATAYTPTTTTIVTGLTIAEPAFSLARVSVRVVLWNELGTPEKWVLTPQGTSAPNVVKLPQALPEDGLYIIQTRFREEPSGDSFYGNGQIAPTVTFGEAVVYGWRDYTLRFSWHLTNTSLNSPFLNIQELTIYYYNLGCEVSSSCGPLTVTNSSGQDLCQVDDVTMNEKCYNNPYHTISVNCSSMAGDWLGDLSCYDTEARDSWLGFGGHDYQLSTTQVTVEDADTLCVEQGGGLMGIQSIDELEFVILSLLSAEGSAWTVHLDLIKTTLQFSRLPDYWAARGLSGLTLLVSELLLSDNFTSTCAFLELAGSDVIVDEEACVGERSVICERPACLEHRFSYISYPHRELKGTPAISLTYLDTRWTESTCVIACKDLSTCTAASYDQSTGACGLHIGPKDITSDTLFYNKYYRDVNSILRTCHPFLEPEWDLVLVTTNTARLAAMTTVGSLGTGSGVLEASVLYPLDVLELGISDFQTDRYVSEINLHNMLLTVTHRNGSVRYVTLDLMERTAADTLQLRDIVEHNLYTEPTSFPDAAAAMATGVTDGVIALYTNMGCTKTYSAVTLLDFALEYQWRTWLTFGLSSPSCYSSKDIDVVLFEEYPWSTRAVSVTMGASGNTWVYFRFWEHDVAKQTQTRVIYHQVPCYVQSDYWLSWANNQLQFGTGAKPDPATVLYQEDLVWDLTHRVRYVKYHVKTNFNLQLHQAYPCKPVLIANATVPALRAQGSCTQEVLCDSRHGLDGHLVSYTTECQADGSWSVVRDCRESIDGLWTEWSDWTECSVTCGNGTQMRNRTCMEHLYAGDPCIGDDIEVVDCTIPGVPFCDVDAVWTEWSPWTDCSVTCDYGTHWRNRSCQGQLGLGTNCTGPTLEVEACVIQEYCSRDGWWTAWGPWAPCDSTCGLGWTIRHRGCEGIIGPGANCSGHPGYSMRSVCTSTIAPYCPVTGGWASWLGWGECDSYCGPGNWSRTRECVAVSLNPDPRASFSCPGDQNHTEPCLTPIHAGCDIDGEWGEWSAWTICSVTCNGGLRNRRRTCEGQQNNGSYCVGSDVEVMTCGTGSCQGVACPDFPEVTASTHDGDSLLVGTVVNYECVPHHRFPGMPQVYTTECNKYAEWEPEELPDCVLKECSSPGKDPHTWWSRNQLKHGVTVEQACETGYEFPDRSDRSHSVCDEPDWSHVLPDCSPRECVVPPLAHTHSYPSSITYGQTVTIRCVKAHKFENGLIEIQFFCTAKGNLSTEPTDCRADHCPPAPYITNTSATYLDAWTLAVSCVPGHRYPDGYVLKYMNCLHSAWVPEILPACQVLTCPPVPTVAYSRSNTTNAVFGTHVLYTCHPGYKRETADTQVVIRCNETGNWSPDVEDCYPIICGKAPIIAQSSGNYSTNISYAVFIYIQYECATSQRFPDGHTHKSVMCQENELWTDIPATCEVHVCPPVPQIANAAANTSLARMGTWVNYICDVGFTPYPLTEGFVTYCTIALMWTVIDRYCEVVYCAKINMPHVEASTTETSYASVVDVWCEYGYIFPNDTESVTLGCLENGRWNVSRDLLQCKVRRCPEVAVVKHADANSTYNWWNSTVRYRSREGFWFPDRSFSRTITCLGDGNWDREVEDCKLVMCPNLPTWAALVIDSEDLAWMSEVNCSCQELYKFEGDNSSYIISTCGSSGVWEPELPACVLVNKTAVVIPLTEAPDSMDIGVVAWAIIACLFGSIIVLDLVTSGPGSWRMLRRNLFAWGRAVRAIRQGDLANAPTPGLVRLAQALKLTRRPKGPPASGAPFTSSPSNDMDLDSVHSDTEPEAGEDGPEGSSHNPESPSGSEPVGGLEPRKGPPDASPGAEKSPDSEGSDARQETDIDDRPSSARVS